MGKFVKHGAREEVPRLQRPIGWVRARVMKVNGRGRFLLYGPPVPEPESS